MPGRSCRPRRSASCQTTPSTHQQQNRRAGQGGRRPSAPPALFAAAAPGLERPGLQSYSAACFHQLQLTCGTGHCDLAANGELGCGNSSRTAGQLRYASDRRVGAIGSAGCDYAVDSAGWPWRGSGGAERPWRCGTHLSAARRAGQLPRSPRHQSDGGRAGPRLAYLRLREKVALVFSVWNDFCCHLLSSCSHCLFLLGM